MCEEHLLLGVSIVDADALCGEQRQECAVLRPHHGARWHTAQEMGVLISQRYYGTTSKACHEGTSSGDKGHHLAMWSLLVVQGCPLGTKLSRDIASGILTAAKNTHLVLKIAGCRSGEVLSEHWSKTGQRDVT